VPETGGVSSAPRIDAHPDDVLLVENAGAYGAVMSSHYNHREPAEEVVLDD